MAYMTETRGAHALFEDIKAGNQPYPNLTAPCSLDSCDPPEVNDAQHRSPGPPIGAATSPASPIP